MNKIELENIIDDLFDANATLEICRGYTQSDEPDMKKMDIVLWNLSKKYEDLYDRLRTI